jgi:hypothetical protein
MRTIQRPDRSKNAHSRRFTPQLEISLEDRLVLASLAWGNDVSPSFRQEVVSYAQQLKIDPSWLMASIQVESNFTPTALNQNSKAVGLIQFLPPAAKEVHTSLKALKLMTADQQLYYVFKYLELRKKEHGQLKSVQDVYLAIFDPAGIRKPNSFILFRSPQLGYEQNRSLDTNHDGKITRLEATARVLRSLSVGLSSPNVYPPPAAPAPNAPKQPSPPQSPPPSTTLAQDQQLVEQITTAVMLPNKPAPPQPDNSAEVTFLLDLADNAFYGPPKPPPEFAIANLINGANNGSVPVDVIAQVLYDISVMFGPISGSGPYTIGSFYADIASEASDQLEGQLISDLSMWGIANLTGSLSLGEQAQQFLYTFDGPILADVATGEDLGDSELDDLASDITGVLFD